MIVENVGDTLSVLPIPDRGEFDRDFTNRGIISISNGAAVEFGSNFLQDGDLAKIELDQGSISVDQDMAMRSGLLTGNGTIETRSIRLSGGKIRPGNGIGQLNFIGDVAADTSSSNHSAQDDSLDLLFELAVSPQSQTLEFDFIGIDGNLELGIGDLFKLEVQTLDGIDVSDLEGAILPIISVSEGNEIGGTFLNVVNGGSLTTQDNRIAFDVYFGTASIFDQHDVTLSNFRVNASAFSLNSVPEPNAILMILFAMTSITICRRRST